MSLRFIRRAKELGFTLKEISELLRLETSEGATPADVRAQAEAKLVDLEERIRLLQRMRRALKKLVEIRIGITDHAVAACCDATGQLLEAAGAEQDFNRIAIAPHGRSSLHHIRDVRGLSYIEPIYNLKDSLGLYL